MIVVMARRGYDGASINQIAEEAGLTSGLVLYHFKKKQDILVAALCTLAERQAHIVEEAVRAAASPMARVDAFIDTHLATGASARPQDLACWVMMGGEALRQPDIGEAFGRTVASIVHRLTQLIREGIAADAFELPAEEATTAESVAAAIAATIQGYFVLAATTRQVIPPQSAAPSTRAMARALLGVAPRRNP